MSCSRSWIMTFCNNSLNYLAIIFTHELWKSLRIGMGLDTKILSFTEHYTLFCVCRNCTLLQICNWWWCQNVNICKVEHRSYFEIPKIPRTSISQVCHWLAVVNITEKTDGFTTKPHCISSLFDDFKCGKSFAFVLMYHFLCYNQTTLH